MKSRSSRCKEAGDALTLGTSDDLGQRRAELHLKNCEDCQEAEEVMAGMKEAVLSANDSLDDLTRARVQSRLAEAMEQAAAEGAAVPLWQRPVVRLVAVAAVGLLALGALLWRASEGPAVSPAPEKAAVASSTGRELLRPRTLVQGSSPWSGAGEIMGRSASRLQVPAGVALRADLSRNAALTLYGPLDLTVEQASGDRVVLRLRRGILVGDYDAKTGGTLIIRSPHAVTEVVGTLFAVEAHDGQSRVSVSRGRVKVEGAGKTAMVGPRRSWSTREPTVGQTPPSVAALFVRHEKEPRAAVGTSKSSSEAPPTALAVKGSAPAPAAVRLLEPSKPRRRPERRPSRRQVMTPETKQKVTPPAPAPAKPTQLAPPAKKKPAVASAHSATQLYKQAEAALSRRDRREAEKLLTRMIRTYPGDARADAARYDLALLLLRGGQPKKAEAALAGIGKASRSRFLGPAHFLRCRIRREAGDLRRAAVCYGAFKDAFPASPHHRQALQILIRLLVKQKRCTRAGGVIADYLAQYPANAFAREARRLRKVCGR